MKKIISILVGFFLALQLSGQEAKYVFYFIGDGMGVNMINFTQYYKAAVAGKHGTLPLEFSKFPVCNYATTWSANRGVTDSAAAGTALATGTKTNNGVLGLDPEGNRLETIAEKSKKAGKKVGIVTTVGANHATPGAFFAHQKSRNNYDQIVFDMLDADFDFYAGNSMLRSKKNKIEGLDYKAEFDKNGYTLVENVENYRKVAKKARKILFLPDSDHKVTKAIERKEDREYTTLADFVSTSVDFLMKGGCPKGFFIMAEGGMIDGCTHGNDAAAAVREILDFEAAIKVAIDFYNAHPRETAIVVTADHDTGGSAVNPGNKGQAAFIDNQKVAAGNITNILRKNLKKNNGMSWDEVREFLSENLGLWKEVKVKEEDEAELRKIYDETIAKKMTGSVTDDFGYNDDAIIVSKAVELLDKYAGITWTSHSHTASFVPVYYIGPRTELFSVNLDNTSIAPKLEQISLKK